MMPALLTRMSRRLKVRSTRFRSVIHAAQIGVENEVPVIGGKLLNWPWWPHDAGIVDENVETAEGAFDSLRERFDRAQVRNVTFDDGALMACILNSRGGSFELPVGAG